MAKRAEWEATLKEQSASGQSMIAFCRERGISANSFQYWRSKLRRESDRGKFIKVGASSVIEIELRGITLRVPTDTPATTWRSILEAAADALT